MYAVERGSVGNCACGCFKKGKRFWTQAKSRQGRSGKALIRAMQGWSRRQLTHSRARLEHFRLVPRKKPQGNWKYPRKKPIWSERERRSKASRRRLIWSGKIFVDSHGRPRVAPNVRLVASPDVYALQPVPTIPVRTIRRSRKGWAFRRQCNSEVLEFTSRAAWSSARFVDGSKSTGRLVKNRDYTH